MRKRSKKPVEWKTEEAVQQRGQRAILFSLRKCHGFSGKAGKAAKAHVRLGQGGGSTAIFCNNLDAA